MESLFTPSAHASSEFREISQPKFICSKLTIETPEKYVKSVQSQNDVVLNDVVLVFSLLTLNIFHTFYQLDRYSNCPSLQL